MDYSKEEKRKIFNRQSQKLQDTMMSIETAHTIKTIGEEAFLSRERTTKLAGITGDIMLSIIPLSQFSNTLESAVQISKKGADKISKEVIDQIFTKNHLLEEIEKAQPSAQPVEDGVRSEKSIEKKGTPTETERENLKDITHSPQILEKVTQIVTVSNLNPTQKESLTKAILSAIEEGKFAKKDISEFLKNVPGPLKVEAIDMLTNALYDKLFLPLHTSLKEHEPDPLISRTGDVEYIKDHDPKKEENEKEISQTPSRAAVLEGVEHPQKSEVGKSQKEASPALKPAYGGNDPYRESI